ncbi:hypothetical protein VP01_2887g2 [Puccinia sorghi]|uniref:Uncharacterized protein n=1 Tax=Puccinia sorghi TaxID=27349 RepID=A0A0L6V1L6_9BASI|nr:hypothetical protein VP01_2887g2 [Puccinia sorghi]
MGVAYPAPFFFYVMTTFRMWIKSFLPQPQKLNLVANQNVSDNQIMLYIIKINSSLGYSSRHFDFIIAKGFFYLGGVELQRISTELRTKFTKNQAKIHMTNLREITDMRVCFYPFLFLISLLIEIIKGEKKEDDQQKGEPHNQLKFSRLINCPFSSLNMPLFTKKLRSGTLRLTLLTTTIPILKILEIMLKTASSPQLSTPNHKESKLNNFHFKKTSPTACIFTVTVNQFLIYHSWRKFRVTTEASWELLHATLHKKLAQLPEVDMQKLPGSFCCYSKLSPRVIQPSFDEKSLWRLHSDCAKTSTYADRWSLDDSLSGACCKSTAGSRSFFLQFQLQALYNFTTSPLLNVKHPLLGRVLPSPVLVVLKRVLPSPVLAIHPTIGPRSSLPGFSALHWSLKNEHHWSNFIKISPPNDFFFSFFKIWQKFILDNS